MSSFASRDTLRSPEETRELLDDLTYLPSIDEVLYVFESDGLLGGEFRKYCQEDHEMYEVLTREFIADLGNYLEERIKALGGSRDNPVTILELGSGNGRLTYFLKQHLAERVPREFDIVAIDDGGYDIEPTFPVENLEGEEAIDKYQPTIAVSAWPGGDWQQKLRDTESVQEYIYIGEPFVYIGSVEEEMGRTIEECREDGFTVEELDELRQHQLCFTDYPGWTYEKGKSHSLTYSFRRKQREITPSRSKREKRVGHAPEAAKLPRGQEGKWYDLRRDLEQERGRTLDYSVILFRTTPTSEKSNGWEESGTIEFGFGEAWFTASYKVDAHGELNINVEKAMYGGSDGGEIEERALEKIEKNLIKSSGLKSALERKYWEHREKRTQ